MVAVTSTENSTPGISSRRLLSGSYTLSAGDDGAWFYALSSVTVYVPAGLNPMPTVAFMPPASGSITLRSLAASVTIAGSTNDYPISIASNPTGMALIPILGQQDQYGVTSSPTFASLADDPKNNTLLANYLAALTPLAPGANKLSAAYTLAATDMGGLIWLNAQAADKIITVPSTILNGTPFWCVIGYLNNGSNAGRCNIKPGGGTSINTTIAQSTGASATLTNGIFMGQASVANTAACLVMSSGASPGGGCFIWPICGTFALS